MTVDPSDFGPSPLGEGSLVTSAFGSSTFTQRLQQVQIARAIGQDIYNRAHNRWIKHKARNKFFVTVEDDDDAWHQLTRWYLEQVGWNEQKSLTAEARYRRGTGGNSYYDLQLTYDGNHQFDHVFDGHEVLVQYTTDQPQLTNNGNDDPDDDPLRALLTSYSSANQPKRIVFTAKSVDGQRAVLDFLKKDILPRMISSEPGFFTYSAVFGQFRRKNAIRPRSMESVILAENLRDEIIEDLENFIRSEERYATLGIPWHRGYLFHGPPGTGKTSFATAIASKFRFNIYFLPLSSVPDDTKLFEIISSIDDERVLLILEDVDIVNAATDRSKDDTRGVTLGGLLNVLDGMSTPHGLITVMTTNKVETLDPALIRPGRADCKIEMNFITDDQLARMCAQFMPGIDFDLPSIKSDIAPAEVVGIFKTDNTAHIHEALGELISKKNYVQEAAIRGSIDSTTDNDERPTK